MVAEGVGSGVSAGVGVSTGVLVINGVGDTGSGVASAPEHADKNTIAAAVRNRIRIESFIPL